jgi:hypothetical protein
MKYTVTATYITTCTTEVNANDADHAYQKAKEMDGGDFKQRDLGDWKIESVELSDGNLTEEQIAFMNAYLISVADADRDTVKAFMLAEDDDTFYKDNTETYSGLADARGMWYLAKEFFTTNRP